jgi:prepilin-type processing-associated H-X9-DG protein
MRRLMALPALLLALAPVCLPAQTEAKAPDRSTPEATVRSFVDAFNRFDLDALVACVAGAKKNAMLEEMGKNTDGKPELAISAIEVKADGDTATVKVKLDPEKLKAPAEAKFVAEETVKLKRTGGAWQIVPMELAELMKLMQPTTNTEQAYPVLTMMASMFVRFEEMMAQGAAEARAGAAAAKADCMSNVKQLCLAAMMCAADFNDTYAFSPANLKARLMPYSRDAKLFACPNAKGAAAAYSMNPAVAAKKAGKIVHPERLVLFYEGAKGKLTYRHKGTATVGFCDGHVERVTPKRAAALRWKP